MAESYAKHQQAMELSSLEASVAETKRGQVFALTIGLAALMTSASTVYMGHPAVAGIIGETTVVGLVTVFVGRFVRPADDNETPNG